MYAKKVVKRGTTCRHVKINQDPVGRWIQSKCKKPIRMIVIESKQKTTKMEEVVEERKITELIVRGKELESVQQKSKTEAQALKRINGTEGEDPKEENGVNNKGEHSRGNMTVMEKPKFRGNIQTYVSELMEWQVVTKADYKILISRIN